MLDKFLDSLAEKVTVKVVAMLEARLPTIIETVTTVALREILNRLGISQLPQSQIQGTITDVLTRLGIRR